MTALKWLLIVISAGYVCSLAALFFAPPRVVAVEAERPGGHDDLDISARLTHCSVSSSLPKVDACHRDRIIHSRTFEELIA
jgi:hypothetical protein